MEKNNILRDNYQEFEKFIKIMAELYKNKIKDMNDTIQNNGITYNLKYKVNVKYNCDKTDDTTSILVIKTSDNREIDFYIKYHKAYWNNDFDIDRVEIVFNYKLPNKKELCIRPTCFANNFKELEKYTLYNDNKSNTIYVGFDEFTCNLFPKTFDMDEINDGIIIRKEMFVDEKTSKVFYFIVSNNGEKILIVNDRKLPTYEEMKDYDIKTERTKYLNSITGKLTYEKIQEINDTCKKIEYKKLIYEQICELYPEIISETKKAVERQKKYNELFMKAHFNNDELAFIRNFIMDQYDIQIDEEKEKTSRK